VKRLLIVADHALVVQAIRRALGQTAGFDVVAMLDGRTSLRARLRELRPDVVLVDDMRDPTHAPARLREVAEELEGAMGILLAAGIDPERTEEAFDAGAEAVLCKAMHAVALGTVLRETVRGTVVHRPRAACEQHGDCGLTHRETEILGLAAQGLTNGRIGRELWITEQTVKFHLSNTYRKLGVANRTEATRVAYASGLVSLGAPDAGAPLRSSADGSTARRTDGIARRTAHLAGRAGAVATAA
jgi:DNA-binding NarL/FixJ family response regulator